MKWGTAISIFVFYILPFTLMGWGSRLGQIPYVKDGALILLLVATLATIIYKVAPYFKR